MKKEWADETITELKEAGIEIFDETEIYESDMTNCKPLLKYSGMIKRTSIISLLDSIRKGKTYPPMKWFDILEYNGSNLANTYKCLCCNTTFNKLGKKLKEAKEGCPNCGVFEDSTDNPMDIIDKCKPLSSIIEGANNYFISDRGEVYSTVGRFKQLKLKNKNGYYFFVFQKKKHPVHRLVLEAFGNPQPQPHFVVRHLNDIPNDNRLENLQWGLQKRNMADKKVNQKRLEEAVRDSYEKGIDIETLSVLTSYSIETLKAILES